MLHDRIPRISKLASEKTRSSRSLSLSLDIFITARQAQRVTKTTLHNYWQFLTPFITWLEAHGVNDPTEIDANHIRAYLVEISDRPGKNRERVTSSTVHTHAKWIKAFLRFLVLDGIIEVSPFDRVGMPTLDTELLPIMSLEDVRKVLTACQTARDRAVILVLLDTGVRASELCKLTVGDVNTATGEVSIVQGKGRKDRTAFLGSKSRLAVLHFIKSRNAADAEPLFPGRGGARMSVAGLRHALVRLGKRAGVDHCHPHTFRRTFATLSLDDGMNISVLQKLMGHEHLHVTERYLNQSRAMLREAHAEHGLVDHLL